MNDFDSLTILPRTKLIELSQVSYMKGYTAHLTIFDERFLSIYIKEAWKKPKHYLLNLTYLEATPVRMLKIDKPSLFITGILACISTILSYIIWNSGSPPLQHPWLPIATPVISATVISLALFIFRSRYRLVYRSRLAQVCWLELLMNSPNRKGLKAFIETLSKHIQEAGKYQSDKHQKRLAAELNEHRRLNDEGILNDKDYQKIRAQLLGQHGDDNNSQISVTVSKLANQG
jgi:hypothetical protein